MIATMIIAFLLRKIARGKRNIHEPVYAIVKSRQIGIHEFNNR
jgi:hypothetical protein